MASMPELSNGLSSFTILMMRFSSGLVFLVLQSEVRLRRSRESSESAVNYSSWTRFLPSHFGPWAPLPAACLWTWTWSRSLPCALVQTRLSSAQDVTGQFWTPSARVFWTSLRWAVHPPPLALPMCFSSPGANWTPSWVRQVSAPRLMSSFRHPGCSLPSPWVYLQYHQGSALFQPHLLRHLCLICL